MIFHSFFLPKTYWAIVLSLLEQVSGAVSSSSLLILACPQGICFHCLFTLRRKHSIIASYFRKIAISSQWVAIRPMLSYAAVVWWTRVDYSTVDKQLEHVQRIACLNITGAIGTTVWALVEKIVKHDQSSLISLTRHCYDWHPGSCCG